MSLILPNTQAPQARGLRAPRGLWSRVGLDETEHLMRRLSIGHRIDRLGPIFWEHVDSGGKRVRARLALGAVEALGGDRYCGIPWAAACELLHNATLVHDDLQDGDRFRRGREATWVRYGIPQAINAGDLGLMLPYTALELLDTDDAIRWRLSRCLASSAIEIVRGQSAELDLLKNGRLHWQAYADAVEGKTAALFSMPIEGAALLAGHSQERAHALAMAFRPIGLLFQIQDDILDLYGDKGRENQGSDLREGKVSALVVEHLRLHPGDRKWLLDLLSLPREETQNEQVSDATARFYERGALDAVWGRIDALESAVFDSPVFDGEPRLHAVAAELVSLSLAPIAHTNPQLRV